MRTVLAAAAAVFLLAACGGDDGEKDNPFTCTEANSLCATLLVPETFSGKTSSLLGLLYARVPPAGPPGAILAQVVQPVIGVNRPYNFRISDIQYSGDYHFVVDLLMEGGGTTSPVAGIDYVYWTPAPLVLDGAPVTLGQIELWLYE